MLIKTHDRVNFGSNASQELFSLSLSLRVQFGIFLWDPEVLINKKSGNQLPGIFVASFHSGGSDGAEGARHETLTTLS